MNANPAQPRPALTDADISALHSMAQAQCERGSPDACCVEAAGVDGAGDGRAGRGRDDGGTTMSEKSRYALWCVEKQRWLRGAKWWRWTRYPRFAIVGSLDETQRKLSQIHGELMTPNKMYLALTFEIRKV